MVGGEKEWEDTSKKKEKWREGENKKGERKKKEEVGRKREEMRKGRREKEGSCFCKNWASFQRQLILQLQVTVTYLIYSTGQMSPV